MGGIFLLCPYLCMGISEISMLVGEFSLDVHIGATYKDDGGFFLTTSFGKKPCIANVST